MATLNKVVRIGTTKTYSDKPASVFIEIEIKETERGKTRLSISGVEGPTWGGNAVGGCGQIDDSIREAGDGYIHNWAPGWNREMLQTLLQVWDEWHLNDMRGRGSAWLYEPLPQSVIDFLESLPETDKPYPWGEKVSE